MERKNKFSHNLYILGTDHLTSRGGGGGGGGGYGFFLKKNIDSQCC